MNTLLSALILMNGPPPVVCPKYLPGTNTLLPPGIHLSYEQNIRNLMRCYCEVVVPRELECRRNRPLRECQDRTKVWIRENILSLINPQIISPVPERKWRIQSIEP